MGEIADQLIEDYAFNGPTEDWQKPRRAKNTIGGYWRLIAEAIDTGHLGGMPRSEIISKVLATETSNKQRNRAPYRIDGALPEMQKAGLVVHNAGIWALTEKCRDQLAAKES
jgi:hypothetical protein